MVEHGVSALLIYGNSGNVMRNEANVYYLSDYMDRHASYLIVPIDKEPVLFVGLYNHLQNAKEMSLVADTRWGGNDPAKVVAAELTGLGQSIRIGIVGIGGAKGFIPHDHYEELHKQMPESEFIDMTKDFVELRLVKSEEELLWLRKAARFTDDAVDELVKRVRPGMKEYELAGIIEGAYTSKGGQTLFFYLSSTSMKTPSRCVPWQKLSSRVVKKGDVILTEISAAYWGYSGQIHRPISVAAEPTKLYRDLYNVAFEAYQKVAGAIRAGSTAKDAAEAGGVISDRGYTIYDSLVHGFGVDLMPPTVGIKGSVYWPQEPFTFRRNMVVVIQPNPVAPNHKAGLQLGNICLVTESGVISLQAYPMEFVRAC
jgi:Xaa-Pro aminopeptidase